MTRHYNNSIAEDAARIFNTKSSDTISSEVNPVIQPTIEIKPRTNISRVAVALNSSPATIYTTPSDKDFYLTNVALSIIKDATATNTNTVISAFIDGVSTNILNIAQLTLTAQSETISFNFNYPIKIDRNTAITVSHGTVVANIVGRGNIVGYTVETIKGV